MLRFPPGLTADLTRVLIAQKLFAAAKFPAALRLNPLEWVERLDSNQVPASSGGSSPSANANEQMLDFIRASRSPVIWIGGETPLQYPHIGQLTREIVNMGRTVFVEKDGRLLRRRIHEFRPESRLYVTVELNGLQESHDLRAGHEGLFRHTLEGVRAAKLSGFLICVQTRIFENTALSELRLLAEQIATIGADGWVVTAANDAALAASTIESARNLIHSRGWRWFSELLERSVAPRPGTIAETAPQSERTAHNGEETAAGLPTS